MTTNLPYDLDTERQSLEERISSAIASAFLHLEAIDRHALVRCQPPLTNAQFHALMAIDRDPGKSLGDLASRLFCDKANASGIVDRLSAMGLVTRVRDALDGRRVVLTLTPAGEAALREARLLRKSALARAFTTLSTEQRQVLDQEISRLVTVLTAINEPTDI